MSKNEKIITSMIELKNSTAGIEKVDGFLRQRYKILCIVFSISQCINQPWLELSSWTGHCKSLNIIVSSSTPCKEMLSGRIHRSMNIFYVAKMESEEDYIVKAINLVTKADTAYNRFLIIRDDVFIFILKLMQLMHQHVKESGDKQNILSLQNENLAVGCILNQYQMDQLRDGQTQFFSMYFTLRENVLPGTCGNQRIVAHFVRTNLTPLQLKRCPLERPVLSLDSHVGLLLPAMKSTRDKHIFVGNIKFFSRLF